MCAGKMSRELLVFFICVATLCACSSEEKNEVVVYAASSLHDAFTAIESQFEALHPDLDLRINFAGSHVLRLQIEQGAPVDLFASANRYHMQALTDRGEITGSETFAHNRLVVIVPSDNPAQIESFTQLDTASRIVIGTEPTPIGRYTRDIFSRARSKLGEEFITSVEQKIVSEESNARLVRSKVAIGEADAAIVYQTDVNDDVLAVAIPDDLNVDAHYLIGTTARARPDASKFTDFLRSTPGQALLAQYGFLPEPR